MLSKKSIFGLFLCILNAAVANNGNNKHSKRALKDSPTAISVSNSEVRDVENVYHCYSDDKCTKITEFTIVTPLSMTCHNKLLEIKFDIYDKNFTEKIEKKGYLSQHPFEIIADQQENMYECQTIKR